MITINLLPPSLKKEWERKTTTGHLVWIAIGLIFLLGMITGGLYFWNTSLAAEGETLHKETSSLEQEIAKYKNTESEVENFNRKTTTIQNLVQSRVLWSKVLEEVSQNTPVDIRLESYKVTPFEEEGILMVEISGKASSRRTVMKFTDRLNSLSRYQNLSCSALDQRTEEGESPAVSFFLKGIFLGILDLSSDQSTQSE